MFYLTGDTHRKFSRIKEFLKYDFFHTIDDVIIILGDVGINYYGDYGKPNDYELKEELSKLKVTLFCIYGNHEKRPENINSYKEKEWRGGVVYWEPEFPNLIFAKDGEIYDFDGNRCIVIGGAHSIDKEYRIKDVDWWADEQPSDKIKARVEERLAKENWKVDVVLSHTCPYKFMPNHALMPDDWGFDFDNSTEHWLDTIKNRLTYNKWYCGHFHTNHTNGKMTFISYDFIELKPKIQK